jgi:hypothetical protein
MLLEEGVFFGNAVKRLSKLNTGFYTRRRIT